MEAIQNYFSFMTISEMGMLVLAAMVILTGLFAYRQKKLITSANHKIEVMQKEFRALANAAVGVGERVLRVERQLRTQNIDKPCNSVVSQDAKVTSYDFVNQPYEQAIAMAQHGASIKDLVSVCGLSESEAELICMIHSIDKAS